MTRAFEQKRDSQRTAGPRLRCFLRGAWGVLVLCWVACGSLHAQLEAPRPIRITHVEGYVMNTHGKPVANTEITLVQNEKVVSSTRTNGDGAFRIDHVSGTYWLRVGRTENAPAEQQIVVTPEIVTRLERKRLYIVVGPGACADACSSVYTDERAFEKAMRKLSGR